MESVKFKLDLGNPMLCFMCPKCFGVTRIRVNKHKLHLSTYLQWMSDVSRRAMTSRISCK